MKSIIFAKPMLGPRERKEVNKVLRSGMIAQGKKVSEFEEKFADFHNSEFASAVNSGTSGLHLALLTLNLTKDDEVIVPGISFAATANAVVMAGGVPVFADIDSNSFNLDVEDFENKITNRTKAVIPVHLFGSMANMPLISEIAKKRGITIIEDAAQAHGSMLKGKYPGEFGDMAVFSFYATKNMTTGEGGIVLSKNLEKKQYLEQLRNQGMTGAYEYHRPGLNNRMTDIQAAMGLEQLKRLRAFNLKRAENARTYDLGLNDWFGRQQILPDSDSSFHQFTVVVPEKRDELHKRLAEKGIPTRIFYPQSLDAISHFDSEAYLPNARKFVNQCLSLPVGPHLQKGQIKHVIDEVNSFIREVK